MDDHYPAAAELTAADIAVLQAIVDGGAIDNVAVHDEWRDDHEVCGDVMVNGVKLSIWWVGGVTLAAFAYSQDPKARAEIVEELRQTIATWHDDNTPPA